MLAREIHALVLAAYTDTPSGDSGNVWDFNPCHTARWQSSTCGFVAIAFRKAMLDHVAKTPECKQWQAMFSFANRVNFFAVPQRLRLRMAVRIVKNLYMP